MEPILEQYDVVGLLGSGGMARVWRVRHRTFGTTHAVKVLQSNDPRLAARLRTEGRLIRTLQHPNVVRISDIIDTASGEPALVMEWVDGPTLADLIGAGRPLAVAEIDGIGREILTGVSAAHARGWVHRDLKPGNVLLARTEGRLVAKVADFGLVKALDGEGGAQAGSTTRMGLGTRRYMSLEQLSGEPADKRMDVFSLGALLFELIDGTPAFPTISAWKEAIRQGQVPPLRRADLPDRFRRVVAAALAPCADRPEDAAALLASWEEGAAPAGAFRAEILQTASLLSDHLPPEQPHPEGPSQQEHLSICVRCQRTALRLREISVPSTVFVGAPPSDAATIVGLCWEEVSEEDRAWLALSIREAYRAHGGRALGQQLEGARFDTPADGLAFAIALHRQLRARAASTGRGLAVRAALHVGDAERAAQLARIARPEQILCSREGVDALGRAVRSTQEGQGDSPLLISHGTWRIQAQSHPVELFEVGAPDEAPMVPPPSGPDAWRLVLQAGVWVPAHPVRHQLPLERDRFVGREADLAALARQIRAGERVVVVHGAAGVGKTRLALHYAWTWLGAWSGGVYFCDLSEARDADSVAHAVAYALDVSLGAASPVAQVGHALAGRGRCLVVLDNFEQVAAHASATLSLWASRAAEATFLVTSRSVLGVGEQLHPLEPLEEDAGMALFTERAMAARRDLDPRREEAIIRELVRLLDLDPPIRRSSRHGQV